MKTMLLRVLGAAAVAGLLAMSPATAAIAADTGVSGTVIDQLTGAPVAAGIVIEHRDGSGWRSTNSDTEGGFSIPDAEPGQYIVHVLATGYVEQWLYGHQNQWEADEITAPATLHIPLMPIQYGTVAGRVTSNQHSPIAHVWVQLRRGGNPVGDTATDENGKFSFPHVETGPNYTAMFTFPSGQVLYSGGVDWEPYATPFTVNPDATTTVDLTRPPVGNLVLKAFDVITGAPIAGYCFYRQDGPVQWNTVCTNDRGKAVVRDLTVGDYSGGGFDPSGIYVNGHFDPATVVEGESVTATVRLEKSVSLHVTFADAASGAPVDGACIVTVSPVVGGPGSGVQCGPQIDLNNLFAEEHFRLFVAPYDHQHGAQWVSASGGGTGDPAQAKVYAPSPGDRIDVTVKLDGAGTVSGVVTDAATGAGLSSVCPSPTAPAQGYGPDMTSDCTWDGHYTIRDLGPYPWKIAFPAFDGRHAWAWSGGAANRAEATAVQVVAGETTTVNVALPATGTVSGTVTVPAGVCLDCVSIVARDATTGDYAAIGTSPRADGTFQLKGFNTQDVRLYYSAGDRMVEYPTVLHTTVSGSITGIAITVPAS